MSSNFFSGQQKMLKNYRGLILFEGIIFTILGILAIAMPVAFTLATDVLFGALLVVGGLMQLFRVCKTWGVEGSWAALFAAVVITIAGAVLLGRPMIGVLALTTILACYFILTGFTKFFFACTFEGIRGRFWIILDGIISLILGWIIMAGLPETATWVIGLFLGIDFVFFGVLAIGFARSIPKKI